MLYTQFATKIDHTPIPKSMTNGIVFLIDFLTYFGLILGPAWLPKSIQDPSNIDSKINSKVDTIFDRFWVACGSVLEAKLVPTSTKMGAKIDMEVEAGSREI